MRECLEACDVARLRALWAEMSPRLPQPKDDAEALICLHHARTQAKSVRFRLRAYSHRWLVERGYPSGLPDRLKPRAEQMAPKIVEAVAIVSLAGSSLTAPIAGLVRDAMSDAVAECYADGRTDPETVRSRILEARAKSVHQLIGIKV
jgi:hypothetical protein